MRRPWQPPTFRPDNYPVRPDWLARHREAALDPELAIVDAHHHLWHRQRRYLLEEFLEDIGTAHNIVATVHVQAAGNMYRAEGPEELQPVGEVEFLNGVAAIGASRRYGTTDVCAGIVGYADLRLGPAVGAVLDAELAASSRFRGIRYVFQHDADPAFPRGPIALADLLRDASFREGFAELGRRGLAFDSWAYFGQLADVAALAAAYEHTPIVVNHVGGLLGTGSYAGKREAVAERWLAGIRELARRPNVFMKLGGLGMPVCGFGLGERHEPPTSEELAAAWGPYFLPCIEAFGAARCMFESNFPPDKSSCSYEVLWNAFKRVAAGASDGEKAMLFAGTAQRAYRLS